MIYQTWTEHVKGMTWIRDILMYGIFELLQ
jgi:hypothetical protein